MSNTNGADSWEPPSKRLKLYDGAGDNDESEEPAALEPMDIAAVVTGVTPSTSKSAITSSLTPNASNVAADIGATETRTPASASDNLKEIAVGITAFVDGNSSDDSGVGAGTGFFQGVLKKRYTDFLVNEILPGGEVLRLKSTRASQADNKNPEVSRREKGEQDALSIRQGEVATSKLEPSSEKQSEGSDEKGKEDETAKEKAAEPKGEASTQQDESNRMDEPIKHTDASDEDAGGKAVVPEKSTVNSSQEKGDTKPEGDSKPSADPTISDEDKQKLAEFLNETAARELTDLYAAIISDPKKKARDHSNVRTEFTTDRSLRADIHQFIRKTFNSRIESTTEHDGTLVLKAANVNARNNRQNKLPSGSDYNNDRHAERSWKGSKLGWLDRGGEYLHFSLYKENKDTMEAISWLTRQLKCNAKNFQFAGTKDRRAVTVQRCSAYRIDAEKMAAQNRSLRMSVVGDFKYQPRGLELGDLDGNEFAITLRECNFAGSRDMNHEEKLEHAHTFIGPALRDLREKGFLNYYGLQRFGTFSERTDSIGVHILKTDFKSACDAILHFHPDALLAAQHSQSNDTENMPAIVGAIGQDDKARALALHRWRTKRNLHSALDVLPRKFSAEAQIIRHLQKSPSDFLGALMTIQRNLRLMYVHAYQSYVWNMAVTERWRLYGEKVTEGDLVLVHEHKDKVEKSLSTTTTTNIDNPNVTASTIDADGEVIIEPTGTDRATAADDVFERARPLTAAEVASRAYSIFDIVLPLPGYDVEYPSNASGVFYKTFMASDAGGNLDPHDMRRKQREFSLSGGYRKMLARIGGNYSFDVKAYVKDEEQFVQTDWERIKEAQEEQRRQDPQQQEQEQSEGKNRPDRHTAEEGNEEDRKIAVILKFQLGTSQYATMALRELSKGGIMAYKADFSGR